MYCKNKTKILEWLTHFEILDIGQKVQSDWYLTDLPL